MASSYLLVYAHAPGSLTLILLGHKNIVGSRVGGRPVRQVIWNNAGQVVVSGGHKGLGETWNESAAREFFEETGVDFRIPVVRQQYGVLAWPPRNTYIHPGNSFAVTYVQIEHSRVASIVLDVNRNIAGAVPSDDELESVEPFASIDGLNALGPSPNPPVPGSYQAQQFGSVSVANKRRRDQQMAAAWDWFAIGVSNCP